MQADVGSADRTTHDEVVRDAKNFDTPSSDASSSDAVEIDSSRLDKGPSEVGSFDAPSPDDSRPDSGSFDAPAAEVSRPDSGSFDVPTREDSRPDAGSFEASPPDNVMADAGNDCFSCEGYLICGGEVNGQIDLMPAADGCYLSGLPGRKLLAPNGTITEGGVVVGKAVSQGAGVDIRHPDGGFWLACRRPSSCDSS